MILLILLRLKNHVSTWLLPMLRLKDGENQIAYFSMEIGIDAEMPTYAGGLGILAGDTLRSMADLGINTVGVTLLSETGYLQQEFTTDNQQKENYVRWDCERYLDLLDQEIIVHTPTGNEIHIRIWQYKITGIHKHEVPILFLDTNYEKNGTETRLITQRLYPTNPVYRVLQEVVLGVGGFKALTALGYNPTVYHLNEGHSAFLTLEFMHSLKDKQFHGDVIEYIRDHCVFTTHTPVPSGHDTFTRDLLATYVNEAHFLDQVPQAYDANGSLNMTRLALAMSNKVNGVAKKHAEVSAHMFPDYTINSITNGVHHTFWTSPAFQMLFDEFIPGWYEDPFALHGALTIPNDRIAQAHADNKNQLIKYIRSHTNLEFDSSVFTIGYARRITKYKRPDLLFFDLQRLNQIAEQFPFQLVFAGKAHPDDKVGKSMITEILNLQNKLSPNIKLIFLSEYSIRLARYIIPGVDIWLNTPKRPLEASGTSGMKSSINGVPNLSVLDGWWIEGHIENITGWSIGKNPTKDDAGSIAGGIDEEDSLDLYNKLAEVVLPMYYHNPDQFTQIRKFAIALIGSYFNSHRMVQQYIIQSYL